MAVIFFYFIRATRITNADGAEITRESDGEGLAECFYDEGQKTYSSDYGDFHLINNY